MAFEYVSTEDAIARTGVRMVVVAGVPSPWGEAAKGILHMKGIDWSAVRLDPTDKVQTDWTGAISAPVLMIDDESARSGWAEILLRLERLAPKPPLLPAAPADRALVLGISHEICGEEGLSWTRRLQLVHSGLSGGGGFQGRVARYLADKYGHTQESGAASGRRVRDLLAMLAARLQAQRAVGSSYYLGDAVSAVDLYAATAMGLFQPLPPEQCPMRESTRAAFETLDAETAAALDPILLEHRDMMYATHLALPLSL